MFGSGIGQAEKEAFSKLEPEIRAHDRLAMDAFNLIGETVTTIPEQPLAEISLSTRINIALLTRISDDLRCIANNARVGYPLQVLTLAAALYESAYSLAYLGADEALAEQWRDYEDPTKPFRSVYDLTLGGLRNLGVALNEERLREQADREYKVYRQFCWAKHVNPVLQKHFGHHLEEDPPAVVFENGPYTSDESVQAIWFALEHAVSLTALALVAFTRHHVPKDRHPTLLEKHSKIGKKRQELAAKAKTRWGTEDPFPGKW
jgi:hypothetical protein